MTTGSFSEREAAMYVAQDHGNFRRSGLELTFVTVRSQGPANDAVAATHLGYTFSAPLIKNGFTNLGYLSKMPIPFQSTGIMTTRRYMNANPEIV